MANMQFLNKLFTKCIFSDALELNIGAFDMGEGMVTVSLDKPTVARIDTATGTVGSLNIFSPATIKIQVLKTSPICQVYYDRILKNGYIGGTLTLKDDTNAEFVFDRISVSLDELPNMNGTEAAVTFIVHGNLQVNKEALGVSVV